MTDLCLVGALGATGFTAYYYIYKWKPQHDAFQKEHQAGTSDEPKVGIVPWVQPQAGGVVFAGAF